MGEVTDYIAGVGEPSRAMLERLRERVVSLVPDAEEGRSYGMAAHRYRGKPLISVVAAKHGNSVFPFSADVVAAVVAGLDGYESTKGGIKFSDAQPLPDDAFDGLVTGRRDEIDAGPKKR
ncbi:DUF1801 domain-containing protein [Actinoplanes sp. LDG1-06]|uniref:DUF1801 domain-containing protein n=1 Tax=Paractinoplanes ovalisporus TaxID=2810368 RepID=A0ABS2A280_9ACTN|nr:DUF1801 domain-containing protein [Actinoplanes ovalisporus]MBM2613938.1 DUF1801 domain-containing protein [Actinoplanes ovalisporus]